VSIEKYGLIDYLSLYIKKDLGGVFAFKGPITTNLRKTVDLELS
jgi:hypothetical protein